jgi:hypothetical protein
MGIGISLPSMAHAKNVEPGQGNSKKENTAPNDSDKGKRKQETDNEKANQGKGTPWRHANIMEGLLRNIHPSRAGISNGSSRTCAVCL